MKKIFNYIMIVAVLVSCSVSPALAQDDESKEPVRDIWAGGILIDNQTTMTPMKKGIDFIIHHRMGEIDKIDDLFGLYAPANIRLGLNYGVTDKLMVGFGSEKNYRMQDLCWKYAILKQNNSGKIPVDVTYYGNFVVDARDVEVFQAGYKFIDRLSYFNQIIIGRKVNDRLSIEVAPSFSHINKVDSTLQNDAFGISAGGRFKLMKEFTFIFEYNQGFFIKTLKYYQDMPKPVVSFGMEVGTPTHAFQLFATTSDKITSQMNYIANKSTKLMVGFNVNVRF